MKHNIIALSVRTEIEQAEFCVIVATISHERGGGRMAENILQHAREEGGLGCQTGAAAAWEMLGEISTVF